MSSIALRIQNISKKYRIGTVRHDTLRDQIAHIASLRFRRTGNRIASDGDEIWALNDVSFDVHHGEIVGIIGRNGAGKSTLLKILSRITVPNSGRVEIFGKIGSLLEVGTGFHPELTGRENIYLNGAILGMHRTEIERNFDDIVAFSEIEKFLDTPVKRYSSGMYVRLAFAVAAHLDTEILLVDEVLAVGDTAFQRKCLTKMDEVSKKGRTVLFVSHNMATIQSLCSRGIYLNNGQIMYDGTMIEAVTRYLQTLEKISNEDLFNRTERQGKGIIKLIKLDIMNETNCIVQSLPSGRPARFVFQLSDILSGTVCIFTLYNNLGQRVAIFNSAISGARDNEDADIGSKFICELNPLLLTPGRYRINVAIEGEGELQDHLEAATFFDVGEGNLDMRPVRYSSSVNVTLPHLWISPRNI